VAQQRHLLPDFIATQETTSGALTGVSGLLRLAGQDERRASWRLPHNAGALGLNGCYKLVRRPIVERSHIFFNRPAGRFWWQPLLTTLDPFLRIGIRFD
jgi:hypothetical protein